MAPARKAFLRKDADRKLPLEEPNAGPVEPHRSPPNPGLAGWAGRSIPSATPGTEPVGTEILGKEGDIGREADDRRSLHDSGTQVWDAQRYRATSPSSAEFHR